MHPVVVSDLDGTLLNGDHELSGHAIDIVRRISNLGVQFIIATGRHHLDAHCFGAQLGINVYTISANGAVVTNPDGEIISRYGLGLEDTRTLIELGRKYQDHATLNLFTETHWYIGQCGAIQREFNGYSRLTYIPNNFNTIPSEPILKVFFIADEHGQLCELEREIRTVFEDTLTIAYSQEGCLEVMPKGVNKGQALDRVLTLEGIDKEDVIAFGDAMNDAQMLQTVGKGVVMGNALPQLRELLPELEVIGSNKDDAVAAYLAGLYRI